MLKTTACNNVQRLSQSTLLAMLVDNTQLAFLESMPLSSWEIISFNPAKLEVCIKIPRAFDQDQLEDDLTALRIELAGETNPAKKLILENAIRTLLVKLDNPPQTTISITLPASI